MSDLLNWLLELDNQIFLAINHGMSNVGLDLIMPNITDLHKVPLVKWLVIPLILAWIVWLRRKASSFILLGLIMSLGIADFVGGKIIKPYFNRPRPNMTDLSVILRSPHFGGASFTSNHASNMFCAMIFLSVFFPRVRWPLIAFACLIGFSRVYVGVHYPSDVVFGALWGGGLGYWMAKLTDQLILKYSRRGQNV